MEDGVFVTNIKATVDQVTLKNYFGQFGTVSLLNLQPDKFNEENKVCYVKYSTVEGASACVKQCDKSTHFGEPLKVAFKKFTERNPNKIFVDNKINEVKSGVVRIQSFGRGRGTVQNSPGFPGFANEVVHLNSLDLPMEKKCIVEIVELKTMTNILVRPTMLTEKTRSDLTSILEKHNKNIERLSHVKNPDINGFYLAKWTEDNQFYRAKILNKIGDGKFEVCFIDEGTSGDIVTELRCVPDDLSRIPCQFLPCVADCQDSAELIDLVLKEGSDKEVSIYAITSKKNDEKYPISIFINDKNIVEIFKSKNTTDPRMEKVPNKCDVKSHKVGQQLSNCRISKDTKQPGTAIVTSCQPIELNPKLYTLNTCPVVGDLLVYKDRNGGVHRCVVEASRFDEGRLVYVVELIDEGKEVDAHKENLMRCVVGDIDYVPLSIRVVLEGGQLPAGDDSGHTIILSDYDMRKNVYTVRLVPTKSPVAKQEVSRNKEGLMKVGQTMGVMVSHVESINEFYVQPSDDKAMEALENMQEDINGPKGGKGARVSHASELHEGDMVVAPFMDVRYRANVRSVDLSKDRVQCFFVDYGNSEWVAATDVIRASDSCSGPPLASRCSLAVPVKADKVAEATEMLLEYCEQGTLEMFLRVVSVRDDGLLLVDVSGPKKSSFGDIIQCQGLMASPAPTAPTPLTPLSAQDPHINDLISKRLADMELRISKLEATNGCR